jgi:hypothetical protein
MNVGRKETRERRRNVCLPGKVGCRIGSQPRFIAIDTIDGLAMPSGLIGILRAPFARAVYGATDLTPWISPEIY